MKKTIRMLTALLTAAAMTMSAVSITAFAEGEKNGLTALGSQLSEETENRTYTLDELFAMSDEEFLKLKSEYQTVEKWYVDSIRSDAEYNTEYGGVKKYRGISGVVRRSADNIWGARLVTDEERQRIKELLGDTVKYEIYDPSESIPEIATADPMIYDNTYDMLIYFPDYKLYAGDTEITHEKIMGFAKCWYCVEQAFQRYDLSYAMWDTVYNTNYCNEKTPEPKNGRNFSFDELNAMTREEFFSLNSANGCIVDIKGRYAHNTGVSPEEAYNTIEQNAKCRKDTKYVSYYGGISGRFWNYIPKPEDYPGTGPDMSTYYEAGITEEHIKTALGKNVEFKITSPNYDDPNDAENAPNRYLTVYIPEMYRRNRDGDISDEDILKAAKLWYCISDIIEIYYEDFGSREGDGELVERHDELLPTPANGEYFVMNELLDMDDEDFLALGGERYYEALKRERDYTHEYYSIIDGEAVPSVWKGSLSGILMAYSLDPETFDYEGTKALLKKAFGNSFNYKTSFYNYYGYRFSMTFPDFEIDGNNEDITDETLMKFAKCWFCAGQIVTGIVYRQYGTIGDMCGEDDDSSEPLPAGTEPDADEDTVTGTVSLKGDADVNGEVSLSDIVVVSKYCLNRNAYPFRNETAKANADMNSDKKISGLDTSALIELNLG